VRTLIALLVFSFALAAAPRPDRWIVILKDPPLVRQFASRADFQSKSRMSNSIATQQRTLRSQLQATKSVRVSGSAGVLLNALFISAPDEAIDGIRQMPGVSRVVRQRYYKRHDAKAADLVRAPFAWPAVGGEENAGAGIRIGILDSGIDKDHPAFQDPSLQIPAGYPKCAAADCDAYTSNKVIAARSFVDLLAFADSPADSRPDDYSPRDRVGHGTAVASIAAGVRVKGPAADVQGVAPKAFLGNYKIFGSPGVNDFASDEAVITAMEAAFVDGMDLVLLSLGAPALWAPDDFDTVCGSSNRGPCDPQVDVVEIAIEYGMAVVTDAGNTGDTGMKSPGLGTINTPGTAPSAITVGGTTNAHTFFSTVKAEGEEVPDNVKAIPARVTDGLKPRSAVTAPLVDVSKVEGNALACQALAAGSLDGAIALIRRGDCEFAIKLRNAHNAGAIAVIFQRDGSDVLFPIGNVKETGIPAVLIGDTGGNDLKAWLEAHPGAKVTIDPMLVEKDTSEAADQVASFSSYGPSIGSLSIKPEIVAVATGMYMATQSYDPNGDMFSPAKYYANQGNSFAAAQVAGAVALVMQKYPQLTPGQLKSTVVNTANANVTDFDSNGQPIRARVFGVGAGKLDVEKAVAANVTVEPATLSFGIAVRNAFPVRTLSFTNLGTSTVLLQLSVQRREADPRAQLNLLNLSNQPISTLSLGPGASGSVRVSLSGFLPSAGSYEGVVLVQGGSVPLRIPFSYMAGDNVPFNLIPLTGDGFVREPNQRVLMNFLVVDRYGVPVVGSRVVFSATAGGGRIDIAAADTDGYGISAARGVTGDQLGPQEFTAKVGAITYVFAGRNRPSPVIASGSVLNAASKLAGNGIAAGSLVTITGTGLSEARQTYSTSYLPLSLSNVSVSFDDVAGKTSYAGRVMSVSDSEVTVQAPWELEGKTTIQTKVSIGYGFQTALVTVPVVSHAPAIFEYFDASGRLVASAVDENNNPVGLENPVAAGAVITLLVNGLGPVNNRPANGAAPGNADSTTQSNPTVTIGGERAEVQFSGLAPNQPGVYQVRVAVPSGFGSGTQPVVLTMNGVNAKTVNTVIR
jgi:uncharacterized protein (TIGR03437 family)